MKIKVLRIRISDQFQNMDEAVLNDYFDRFEIITINTQLIQHEINYWSVLITYQEIKGKKSAAKPNVILEEELSEDEMGIYNKLKDWRSEKARESQLPPYIIFHNVHLISIAKYKPNNLEDLENINGLGKSKTEKYGIEIIEVLENA